MPLASTAIALIIVGLLLYLAVTYIPMNAAIRNVLIGFVVVFVVIWLLQGFGLLGSVGDIRIG